MRGRGKRIALSILAGLAMPAVFAIGGVASALLPVEVLRMALGVVVLSVISICCIAIGTTVYRELGE